MKDQQEKAPEQTEYIPYQCCPVCNGLGQVLADGFIRAVYQPCKVCHGAMIIPMHKVQHQINEYSSSHPSK